MTDKLIYYKNYYKQNKDKMIKQMQNNYTIKQRENIIKKLNNGSYARLPLKKIEKYDIKIKDNKYV